MTLGRKIKELRRKKRLTQKALAELSGVSEIAIRKYEAGDRVPRKEQLEKLSKALDDDLSQYPIHETIDDDIIDLKVIDRSKINEKYKTVADVLKVIIDLDVAVGISLEGTMDENGTLIPDSISVRFDNQEVNECLSEWGDLRNNNTFKLLQLAQYTVETDEGKKQQKKIMQDLDLNLVDTYQEITLHSLLLMTNDIPLEKNKKPKAVVEAEEKIDNNQKWYE